MCVCIAVVLVEFFERRQEMWCFSRSTKKVFLNYKEGKRENFPGKNFSLNFLCGVGFFSFSFSFCLCC